jgi:hypothetical protein
MRHLQPHTDSETPMLEAPALVKQSPSYGAAK